MDFNKQQKKAVYTIDRNISVSAGAGSGKTRVLVERFVHILHDSAMHPEREAVNAADIMAITFTKKAAGEMKERIRESISIKINGKYDEEGNLLQAADNDNKEFWKQQLESLERAQINTMHSFCGRVLRENPVEAGIDPSFITLEDFDNDDFIHNGIKSFLRQQLKQGNADVAFLADVYGLDSLESQLQAVYPKIVGYDFKQDTIPVYEKRIKELKAKLSELYRLVVLMVENRDQCYKTKTSDGRKKLDALADDMDSVRHTILESEPDYGWLKSLTEGLRASKSNTEWVKPVTSLVKELDAYVADKKALDEGYLSAWDNVLQGLQDYLEQEKLKQDMLNFDDLENMAIRLLKHNPLVCQKYMRKFKHIMVDEFQDTNDKQRQLVYLLCGGDAEELNGRKLFIVGDPKQSIYRFRNADVSVFLRVQSDIANTNKRLVPFNPEEEADIRVGNLEMGVNYRSSDKVLEACNAAFRQLLGEKKDVGAGAICFESLDFGNKEKGSPLIPELILLPMSKDEMSANQRLLEAQGMANKIVELHKSGVKYGDMAVLVRATTYNKFIVEAFMEKAIPYQIIDAKGFYDQQEILDVLNLLQVLQNKHNSIQLAGVLRSPYFGVDDNAISRLFVEGEADSLWDNLQTAAWEDYGQEQGARLKRAAEVLAQLRNTASFNSLSVLWEQLWQLLRLDVVLSRQLHGANRLANVRKLEEMSQKYSAAHGGALGDWLSYVKRKRAMNADDRSVNLPLEDAVQIMTIHKSKGLEFNTVFVPFLDKSMTSNTDGIRYLPGKSSRSAKRMDGLLESGLGIKIAYQGELVKTGVYEELSKTDKALEQEELLRLLYVVMTRAEERLFLLNAVDAEKLEKGSLFGKLERTELVGKNWLEQLLSIFGGKTEDEAAAMKVVEQDDTAAESGSLMQGSQITVDDELKASIAPFVDTKSSGRRHFTASNLQEYLHCPRSYYYEQVLGLPMEEREDTGCSQNLPANITGLIVHTALEKYNSDADAAFNSAVYEHARGQKAAKAAELFYSYIKSDLYKELADSFERDRELEFALYEDNGLVLHGVIDSLGQNQDGSWSIIDYKTGRAPEPGEVPLGYVYQLAIYKRAAEKLFGRRVKDCALHYLQNLSCFKMPQDKDYWQEAVALCEKISSSAAEKDFPCRLDYCCYCPYAYMCPGDDE